MGLYGRAWLGGQPIASDPSVIAPSDRTWLQAYARPPTRNSDQQREAIARREAGEALTSIARTFGVSHTTIGRL
jgi:hypothetical protein